MGHEGGQDAARCHQKGEEGDRPEHHQHLHLYMVDLVIGCYFTQFVAVSKIKEIKPFPAKHIRHDASHKRTNSKSC